MSDASSLAITVCFTMSLTFYVDIVILVLVRKGKLKVQLYLGKLTCYSFQPHTCAMLKRVLHI